MFKLIQTCERSLNADLDTAAQDEACGMSKGTGCTRCRNHGCWQAPAFGPAFGVNRGDTWLLDEFEELDMGEVQ